MGTAVNILFLHQNFPGQFGYLALALAADPGNRVVAMGRGQAGSVAGVRMIRYSDPPAPPPATHNYLRRVDSAVRHGQQVVREAVALKREGFDPALVIAHPAWGEALFVKDVWPRASLLVYAEHYYRSTGADIGFDPAHPPSLDVICRARVRNAQVLLSLEAADAAISPTKWQRSLHPRAFHSMIRTIFDGIDTARVCPDPTARFTLDDGRTLTCDDEVLTYVARNLEPIRGFPSLIRALPAILDARPAARAVIVGGDGVSYGDKPENAACWREAMLVEVPLGRLADRIHFTGPLPYARYLNLLQVSSAHLYLTYPFVLSWSCLEAMAAGCLLVASNTAPVTEVVRDGGNGFLVPFFDTAAIAARVVEALAMGRGADRLRAAARRTIVEGYALPDCLRRQFALIASLTGAPALNVRSAPRPPARRG